MKRKIKLKESELFSLDKPPVKKYEIIGMIIIIFFIGFFIFWAGFSTLESAAVAKGLLVAESKNKSIQHLEGGIIDRIHVKEGSKVTKGTVLITLDTTQAQSSFEILQQNYYSLLAERDRLVAERDKKKVINWHEAISKEDSIKNAQINIMSSNQLSINGQLKILNHQLEQLDQEIVSYKAQMESKAAQLGLIKEEIVAVVYLYKRKLIELPKLLELKRMAAKFVGDKGQYLGLISKAQQKKSEIKQRIITLEDNYLKDVLDKIKIVEDKLGEVKPKLNASLYLVKRTKIISPTDGIVIGLNKFTNGAVIRPGETLMQLLPLKDKLIAEVRVQPNDIELIHLGQKARVYLNALKKRNSPSLVGAVTHVSADIFMDENNNESFYKVKVSLDKHSLERLSNIPLYPGMQLQVMIVTQKRTPFDYLITPIQESFRFAFREN